MINPYGTGSPSPSTQLNAQTSTGTPKEETLLFALRRCGEHKATLRNIWLGSTRPPSPTPPEHCPLLEGGKRLEKRKVEASSSRQESTDSDNCFKCDEFGIRGKYSPSQDKLQRIWDQLGTTRAELETTQTELERTQTELERMDERVQEGHQRYCQLYKKYYEAMSHLAQAEFELDKDFEFYYREAFPMFHENRTEAALHKLRFSNVALTDQVYSLQRELLEARRQVAHPDRAFIEDPQETTELSRRNAQLENELHKKNTMLEAKQEQLSKAEALNVDLIRRLTDMHQRAKSKGADAAPKEPLSQLQNDLRETRSVLQEREYKVSSLVANATPRALSTDNQTTEIEAAPDEAH
ncbi:hypothetical protein [Endozoicomonas sp. 2B-B]